MGDIFYWVLNMSLSASLAGIVILLLRSIKRIPRRVICLLWAIPLIRLIIPVGVSGKYSLMSLISRFTTKTVTVFEKPRLTSTNYIMAADSYFPISYKVNILEDVMNVGFFVWAVVALALIIALVFIYFSTMKELKDAERLKNNIYFSDKVNTPAVYGVIKPRIIFPSRETDNYVLLHEQTHIKRQDNLWRIIAISATCIHWFNPIVWLFLRLYIKDSELACDEAVIAKLPRAEHKEYALTLLRHTEARTVYASPFGGAVVKTRIERILSYKKLSVFSVISFIVLIVFISYFLLMNSV